MTKAELIDAVHTEIDSNSKKETAAVVQATMDALAGAIREGRFRYPGFGTFNVRERAARDGRNPQTGKKIKIPASKTISFKPASSLKGSL